MVCLLYPIRRGGTNLLLVSVFDIFFAWSTGICLCSGTKDFLLRDLTGAINALGITHLSMTPTVAALVNPEDVPRVEFLVTAGEAVTQKVFRNWAGKGLFQGITICMPFCLISRLQWKLNSVQDMAPARL